MGCLRRRQVRFARISWRSSKPKRLQQRADRFKREPTKLWKLNKSFATTGVWAYTHTRARRNSQRRFIFLRGDTKWFTPLQSVWKASSRIAKNSDLAAKAE